MQDDHIKNSFDVGAYKRSDDIKEFQEGTGQGYRVGRRYLGVYNGASFTWNNYVVIYGIMRQLDITVIKEAADGTLSQVASVLLSFRPQPVRDAEEDFIVATNGTSPTKIHDGREPSERTYYISGVGGPSSTTNDKFYLYFHMYK